MNAQCAFEHRRNSIQLIGVNIDECDLPAFVQEAPCGRKPNAARTTRYQNRPSHDPALRCQMQ